MIFSVPLSRIRKEFHQILMIPSFDRARLFTLLIPRIIRLQGDKSFDLLRSTYDELLFNLIIIVRESKLLFSTPLKIIKSDLGEAWTTTAFVECLFKETVRIWRHDVVFCSEMDSGKKSFRSPCGWKIDGRVISHQRS